MANWEIIVLSLYVASSFCLAVYGSHCYLMIFLFLKRQKKSRNKIQESIDNYILNQKEETYPYVTIQLPFYNEKSVVERVMLSAAEVDYPKDKFEIQILDDSNDETVDIVNRIIETIRSQGINISVIRRHDRKDYKAGALANGMTICKGEFIAIFDADFIVPKSFLKRAIPLITAQDDVACVQGRWGHINSQENWLTKAQSVGIDGHFAAEQGARSYYGMCLNFNGTGGVWRKSAILAGGGWQGDTLTEDLDLSYRVQMEGYRIVYDFDNVCLAEIPNDVIALKSQQKRWAKGSMQTAIKLAPRIIKSKRLAWYEKIEAMLHMTHYSVAIFMTIVCTLTFPVLGIAENLKVEMNYLLYIVWSFILISALAPCAMYTGSGIVLGKWKKSIRTFPAMMVLGTGLCVNNALAVLEAFTKKKTAFVRTPKSGSTDVSKKKSLYQANTPLLFCLIELTLGIYAFATLYKYTYASTHIFGLFILSYAIGMTCFGYITLRYKAFYWFSRNSKQLQAATSKLE
ncbi:MAG: glycosyl transferase family 2 [Planctomycetota bacterium]|nr:MAG: glycosyl transferase family 2 [Planctomycetota bacterium]